MAHDKRLAKLTRLVDGAREAGLKWLPPEANPYLFDADWPDLERRHREHEREREKQAKEAAKQDKRERKAQEKAGTPIAKLDRG